MNEAIPSDAITSLLLFLLGAPALVYQMVPEEIRGLVIPKWSFYVKFVSPLILGILTVAVTYFIGARVCADCSPSSWNITLAVLFLLSILTGVLVFPTISKQQLINKLVSDLLKNYREGGEYPDEELANLELIGKESKGGEERKWSITALDQLADRVLYSPSYSGGQLEGLIQTLNHILLESDQASTPDNYRGAIAIMHKIIDRSYRCMKDDARFGDSDLGHAWRSLGVWAQKSLDLPEQGITADCLNLLDIEDGRPNQALSEALREIGIAAVLHDRDQMQIALQAVRKMQIILQEGDAALCPEVMYDQIGLVSYIWLHGKSGEDWIRQDFDIYNHVTCELIREAIEHHRKTAHFEIADNVKKMYAGWSQDRQN